ncbi:MAG: ATP-binding cassette domain-containing protein [Atopobiaceae bacterium]
MGRNELISLHGVSKSFGSHRVLDGIDLEVSSGIAMAICGRSGSGKSTLLNILGLLEPFDSGTYTLMGQKAPKPGTRAAQMCIRDHICYLLQNFALVENDTVYQNLMMALRYAECPSQKKRQLIARSLKTVGLSDALDQRVCNLSGGEQQRVALARCLVKPGDIVLADEPTGSLDSKNRDIVMGLLLSMREYGKTILVVTHDPVVAKAAISV